MTDTHSDEQDEEYLELMKQITDAGWYPGGMMRYPDGVMRRQFRDHTANYHGMKERFVFGKTDKEVFRTFLKELEDEREVPEQSNR